MKVLTLHQPWATLIALGVKTIETRGQAFRTLVGQRVAIHAAAREPECGDIGAWSVRCDVFDGWEIFTPGGPGVAHRFVRLPLGAIVCTAVVIDSLPMVQHPADVPPGWTGACLVIEDEATLSYSCGDYDDDTGNLDDQLPYGDYSPGRYGLLLDDVRPLAEPVPFKGGQGLSRSVDPALLGTGSV